MYVWKLTASIVSMLVMMIEPIKLQYDGQQTGNSFPEALAARWTDDDDDDDETVDVMAFAVEYRPKCAVQFLVRCFVFLRDRYVFVNCRMN